ncbi:uncharacterized protein [Typha latifolia]|uniref:uncharacterized protein n=1 Tax=Typha latifolia TaxID=4733 RepID=UPI003C2B5576
MGASCCVAARDKPLPTQFEVSTYRNVRHSPSWSFRWDNRTHIEDIMDNRAHFSQHSSVSVGSEIRSGAATETEGLSDEGSPSGASLMVQWHKSHSKTATFGNFKAGAPSRDLSMKSSSSPEVKDCTRSLGMGSSASDLKPPISFPSTPSSSGFRADPSSSRSRSLPSDPASLRKARRSPGYQLTRQISDSRIPSLKSLNENSSPEGRQSFVLSACSNDLSAGGSYGGSSDGWSMRTFSELVASSQRERWSFESENLSSGKITRLSTQQSVPLSPDQQRCKACSKLLKEKSPWSTQKIFSTNELSVVAVLVCGHVYHADCLENMTLETDKYDPPCPICTHGEKCTAKLFEKIESKVRSKISRSAVADVDANEDSLFDNQKRGGKSPRMGASSSTKSSFGRPSLMRHFSIGSRPSRSVSESESTRKKGFWSRYRRE